MRILYLHQYFNLPSDPGSTRSYEMARRLVLAGHKVYMITSDHHGRFKKRGWYVTEEAGIEVHWLYVPYSNKMSYSNRIKAFLKFAFSASLRASSIPADVVFATSTPLTIAIPGVFATKRLNIPLVFELRDLWPEIPIAVGALKGPMIPAAKLLERFAYKHSEQIVTLSPDMKKGVAETGYPSHKIHVIPNSADIDLFSVPASKGETFRRQHDWLGNNPLVIYAGTFGKINGVSYLAKLAYRTKELNPKIKFLTIGDGAEKERVKNTAILLGVWQKNFFMMDSLPKKQMPIIFSAATIAVSLVIDLTELWANSANKFFDALASGTPIAINYLGWQAEIIKKHKVGLILSPSDISKAAHDLVLYCHNPQQLLLAANNAQQIALEKYNRDLLTKKLESVLMKAIGEKKPESLNIPRDSS